VITAVVNSVGPVVGRLIAADVEIPENDLNPIALEMKEVLWGFGSFAVFALVLRYAIWPPLKRSIDGRNERIAENHAAAEAITEAAKEDVAAYEAKRAEARAAAHEVVEAARSTIEAERTDRVAAANAEIAQRRAAAMAEVDAAREAARGEVEAAVASVTASLAERALGQRVTDDAVARAVGATSTIGAAR